MSQPEQGTALRLRSVLRGNRPRNPVACRRRLPRGESASVDAAGILGLGGLSCCFFVSLPVRPRTPVALSLGHTRSYPFAIWLYPFAVWLDETE